MCDDLNAQIKELEAKNVRCSAIDREPWGMKSTIQLSSRGESGLYQPAHPPRCTSVPRDP